ncbi:DUF998 domain-containing protein [Mycobacterium sp. SMC-18]|uniref:DUF998 domain-containing protein n=1 Tax=Mycobacteriaceae TaxID=1762 RepID=UPI001BB3A5C4|nr:DUF998 domain-containing protein [Mycolicibacterium sp. TY66]BCI80232.1 hypothetical protein MTY66_18570 [Mycolicibacterium sp. TY66]BCJ82104.1 hypothetical protein MTY81_34770 [Mycolicibacterium sp. TY81]
MTAAAAPAVLVVAAILARAALTTSYDSLSETLSVLAGRGSGQGIMTAGFMLSAACQIATAMGLRVVRLSARIALATAGCCGLVVAAFPVTVRANESTHLLAAGGGLIALALVPILGMSSGSTTPLVCRPRWALTATLVLCALVLWVYYEANHGVFLGLAERLTAVAGLTWPVVVVVFARRVQVGERSLAGPLQPKPVPRERIRIGNRYAQRC